MTSATVGGPRPTRRARRIVWALVVVILGGLVAGGFWASSHGYVSWTGTVCTDEGIDPSTSYAELVTEHDKSPYCARQVRGETWF